MTEDNSNTETKAEETVVEVEPGSWQETLTKSAALLVRGKKASAKAGDLLWAGAQEGINDWLGNDAETDAGGEGLYNTLVSLLGKPRKGDASKIKTVALAVKDNGLVLASQQSLAKAYAEAKRLTVTVKQDAADDTAADEAVEAIAENAPKSTSTPEGAALLVLAKGVDEAVRLLLDALNGPSAENNPAAHRAFLRAVSQEIAGRVPKPEPKPKAAPKSGKPKAKTGSKAKAGAGKAKPKPNPKAPRKPVSDDSLNLNEADVPDAADQFEDETTEANTVETPEVPVKAKAKPVARPVVRRG